MWKKISAAVAASVILVLLIVLSQPENRVKRFVFQNHMGLEQSYQLGTVPAGIGYKSFNFWDGEHPMMEFILFTRGGTYYGCYYSPDNVPLSFQNTEIGLTQTAKTEWSWQDNGDNRGRTFRIIDKWFYFDASL